MEKTSQSTLTSGLISTFTWLESIESQIIEGGTGDLLMVAGRRLPWLTAEGLFATTLDVARMRALDLLVPRPVG